MFGPNNQGGRFINLGNKSIAQHANENSRLDRDRIEKFNKAMKDFRLAGPVDVGQIRTHIRENKAVEGAPLDHARNQINEQVVGQDIHDRTNPYAGLADIYMEEGEIQVGLNLFEKTIR